MTAQQIRNKYCLQYGKCNLRSHACIRGVENQIWYCLQGKKIVLGKGRLVEDE